MLLLVLALAAAVAAPVGAALATDLSVVAVVAALAAGPVVALAGGAALGRPWPERVAVAAMSLVLGVLAGATALAYLASNLKRLLDG